MCATLKGQGATLIVGGATLIVEGATLIMEGQPLLATGASPKGPGTKPGKGHRDIPREHEGIPTGTGQGGTQGPWWETPRVACSPGSGILVGRIKGPVWEWWSRPFPHLCYCSHSIVQHSIVLDSIV